MSTFGFPRLDLNIYPTPLQEMRNLRDALGVKPRLFVKRDDMTRVGLGGNKNRKLDYVMYEARDQGADTIVTWGGQQSNSCRQALAYARLLGMECHIVVDGVEPPLRQGNLLIFDLFGAQVHFEPDKDRVVARCEQVTDDLRRRGRKPYYMPIGASTPLGSVGYIDSFTEILAQGREQGVEVSDIFFASGSAGTQSGLVLGARLAGAQTTIHGVAISRSSAEQTVKVAALCNEVAAFIGRPDLCFEPGEIVVHDEYYGPGYAVPTPEGMAAIRLVGRTEAILLDPVYTGKAMAGLLDLLAKGALDSAGAIVFIHTGGSPAVFNFAASFAQPAPAG